MRRPELGDLTPCHIENNEACTLIWPKAERYFRRRNFKEHVAVERITGFARGLLIGYGRDTDSKLVFRIDLSFASLDAWLGHRTETVQDLFFPGDSNTEGFCTANLKERAFYIAKGWRCTLAHRTKTETSPHRATLVNEAHLLLTFDDAITISESIEVASAFAILFRFLTGLHTKYDIVGFDFNPEHGSAWMDCHLGGIKYEEEELSVRRLPLHFDDLDIGCIERAICAFWDNHQTLMPFLVMLENAWRFEPDFPTKYRMLAPALEQYLTSRYPGIEEISYMDNERTFFEYIDQSDNSRIKEFSKKHLKVIDRKAPGLRQRVEQAISTMDHEGVPIPKTYAKSIAESRHRLSHASSIFSQNDFDKLYLNTQCVIILLIGHIFLDLSIPIGFLGSSAQLSDALEQIQQIE